MKNLRSAAIFMAGMAAGVLLTVMGLLVVAAIATAAEPITGPMTHVVDGDTFDIGATRIRVCGVNAPELHNPGGYAATGYLAHRWSGKTLTCIPVGSGTPCDGHSPATSWGRVVAQCFYDGHDIAQSMVDHGYAVDWPEYSGGYYAK